MLAALAALPIALILVLMVGARWSAARAGLAGVAVTTALAVTAFGYGTRVLSDRGIVGALGGALAETAFTAVTILWIIGPALGIHHLQTRTGGTDVLRLALGRLSTDPRIVALLVAWFFALFIEGAAGFGASVALAAPFLVTAGFRRVEAVTIVLIGHAVGVSFGAVGTPVIPQVAATGLGGLEIARATGIYHALLGWVPLFAVGALVSRGRDLPLRPVLGWMALAGVLFLVPAALLSRYVGPELPTLGGALIGGLIFVAVLQGTHRRDDEVADAEPAASGAGLLRAAAPYLVLVALVLVTRLLPPLQRALTSVVISWEWGPFSGSVQPLYHPGTVLLVSFALGALLQRARVADVTAAVVRATRQLAPVTVALLAMLALARIMVHSGMVATLAEATAAFAGQGWPALAPLVGALGTFITGSATASNILFTDLQQATAQNLSMPEAPLIGAQGFGAAAGNMICPHNVVAASATVAISGREGEVLRRTLGVALTYVAFGGLLAMAFVHT